jgi:hypothetical protein
MIDRNNQEEFSDSLDEFIKDKLDELVLYITRHVNEQWYREKYVDVDTIRARIKALV